LFVDRVRFRATKMVYKLLDINLCHSLYDHMGSAQ
jgi:hypothetical protein